MLTKKLRMGLVPHLQAFMPSLIEGESSDSFLALHEVLYFQSVRDINMLLGKY